MGTSSSFLCRIREGPALLSSSPSLSSLVLGLPRPANAETAAISEGGSNLLLEDSSVVVVFGFFVDVVAAVACFSMPLLEAAVVLRGN